MKQLLASEGLQLTKSLGQNFLHDGNQLRRIAAAAELSGLDSILEIGPGLGPLTEFLLSKARHVTAIEKDARLVKILQERFASASDLELIHADALEYLEQKSRDWTDWKMVSNLPYSVASPILVELAQSPGRPQMLVATLQLEVAQRLMAQPSSHEYGILTLLVQVHYEPAGLFKIPSTCFFPPPDVDSACIKLVRRRQPLLAPPLQPNFTRIVKRSFSQRRKMMQKLLREDYPLNRLQEAFTTLGIEHTARAETVSLAHFVRLTELLATS